MSQQLRISVLMWYLLQYDPSGYIQYVPHVRTFIFRHIQYFIHRLWETHAMLLSGDLRDREGIYEQVKMANVAQFTEDDQINKR